jgi:choline dehydrogenase-like flavoprotein
MLTNQTAALFAQKHNVCVVGAGPVGLVVALELARLGQQVTLLESGAMQVDHAAQSLSDAIVVDARRHTDMSLAIQRRFGGTSNLWGAGCVPLDPIDFESRSIAGDARWPLSYDEFAAHLPDACRYANCGDGFSEPVADLTVADARFTADRLIRYADPPSFRKAYAASVASSPRIAAFLGVTVTGFSFAENGAVAGIDVQARDGVKGAVKARVFVLACGGVETTRLLLAAQAEAPARFGGEDGALGRYYMGHLSGVIADLRLDHCGLDKGLDFFRGAGGAYARRRITADAALQREKDLSNIAFWPIMPPMRDPSHRDPILSLAYLALSLPPVGRCLVSESLRRINVGDGGDKLAHLGNVVAHTPKVVGFVPRFLYGRYLASRRLPGLHLRNGARRYALQYHAEHLPSRASRIRLANERDATGLRKAVLDLRFADADADPIVRTHDHLADWLARTGTGELIWRRPVEERRASVLELAGDGVHQIGAARMAVTGRQGVVDRDCRVFGSGTLFLAGSVVFPTSGQANPTLTALALGIRQARLIAAEAAAHEVAH